MNTAAFGDKCQIIEAAYSAGDRGLTQQQLADAAGISKAYLAQIESGKRQGNARGLQALAEALDIELDEILNQKCGIIKVSSKPLVSKLCLETRIILHFSFFIAFQEVPND